MKKGTYAVWEIVDWSKNTVEVHGGILDQDFQVGRFGSYDHNAWQGYGSEAQAKSEAAGQANARYNDPFFRGFTVTLNGVPYKL